MSNLQQSAEHHHPPACKIPRGVNRGAKLSDHTTMHVGGRAAFLSRPESVGELQEHAQWAAAYDLPVFILGGGSNVIFSDDGFPGLILCTQRLVDERVEKTWLTAEAGVPLNACVRFASEHGLSGLEWAAGIPGTIGGAVAMNAGAFGEDVASVLESVRVLHPDGTIALLRADELGLGYRTSAFLERTIDGVALEARFALRTSTVEACEATVRAILEQRRGKFPQGASSGCIFRNPLAGPTAAELLDRAGCKGMREGAAYVSELHANFIVNEGRDNARDILRLMERMEQRVLQVHGRKLQPEVVLL